MPRCMPRLFVFKSCSILEQKTMGCQGKPQGCSFFQRSQYPGKTGYWMPRHMPGLLLVSFTNVAVSWNTRLLRCQGIHHGCLFKKLQYSWTTGYWMPRLFVWKKLQHTRTWCYWMPGCTLRLFLFKKLQYPGMTGYWIPRHIPRLFV
jgi:hypothetical protein